MKGNVLVNEGEKDETKERVCKFHKSAHMPIFWTTEFTTKVPIKVAIHFKAGQKLNPNSKFFLGLKFWFKNFMWLATTQSACHVPVESTTNIPLHGPFEYLVWKYHLGRWCTSLETLRFT